MKPTLEFKTQTMRVSNLGVKSSVPDLLGNHMLQNHLEFHLGEEDEIFEAYGTLENSYPYPQNNGYETKVKEKEMKTAVLENDFLRAVFLPQLGGRLWSLYDKKARRDLIYTNYAIKFRNLAICNAWFSGGVEWNLGIIGHTPFTTEPLFTAELLNEEGVPILRMYEYERIRQVEYQMDFWLGEQDDFLSCRMRVTNSGKDVVPMYWWSNIAVPEYENGRIVVPAQKAYTSSNAQVRKVDVPVVEGVDVSFYKNIPRQVDYFFEIPAEEPKYIVNLDQSGYGLLHISTDRLKSRKLFSWGNNEGSDNWQKFLTENGGRYLEIQAGLGKTQYGCIPMPPHTAWEWMEEYSAVQLPPQMQRGDFEKLQTQMTNHVQEKMQERHLRETLAGTKKLAKTPAKLLYAGSSYGALKKFCREMEQQGKEFEQENVKNEQRSGLSSHLDFGTINQPLTMWKDFLETGILAEPSVNEIPGDFLCEQQIYEQLRKSVKKTNKQISENYVENRTGKAAKTGETAKDSVKESSEQIVKNWYAFYQMGLYELWKGELEQAKQSLQTSLNIQKSPWAYQALASCYMMEKEFPQAICSITAGVAYRMNDLSYLKDTFRMLLLAGGNQELLEIYSKLTEKLQKDGRLYFGYLNALANTGESQKAYELLKSNEAYMLEDLRECEGSLEEFWKRLESELLGKAGEIPPQYRFTAL